MSSSSSSPCCSFLCTGRKQDTRGSWFALHLHQLHRPNSAVRIGSSVWVQRADRVRRWETGEVRCLCRPDSSFHCKWTRMGSPRTQPPITCLYSTLGRVPVQNQPKNLSALSDTGKLCKHLGESFAERKHEPGQEQQGIFTSSDGGFHCVVRRAWMFAGKKNAYCSRHFSETPRKLGHAWKEELCRRCYVFYNVVDLAACLGSKLYR